MTIKVLITTVKENSLATIIVEFNSLSAAEKAVEIIDKQVYYAYHQFAIILNRD